MADEDRATSIAREVILSTFAGEARGLSWAFRRVSAVMQDVFFAPGDVVFEAGGEAVHQYFIVDGTVRLTAPGRADITFGSRSVIGAMDAILERPLASTALAATKVHILRMRTEDWFDVLEDSFELSRLVVSNMATGLLQLRLRPPPLGGFVEQAPVSLAFPDARHLYLVDRIVLLRGAPIFERASIQTLTSLAELAEEIVVEPGHVLAERGAPNPDAFFVASGMVSATPENPALAGRFGPGELVCGAAAVARAGAYELRAESRTRALAIARDDYLDVMEEHFGLVRSTLRGLLQERDHLLLAGELEVPKTRHSR